MANISTDLDTIKNGIYGSDIRMAIYRALNALNVESVGGVDLTEEDYEALDDGKNYNNVTYYIIDKGYIMRNGIGYSGGGAQTAGIVTHDMIGSVGVAGIMEEAE